MVLIRLATVAALIPVALAGPGAAAQPATGGPRTTDSMDVRTVRGLQQRRLYDLAIWHAEAALQRPNQPVREQINLAVLIVETTARRAAISHPELRNDAWQQATETARQYQTRFAGAPRVLLLDVQATLVDQTRIEQLAREIEAQMAEPAARERAQQLALGVQRGFEQIQARIATLVNRPESARPAEALSPAELLTLRYNVEYQAARALMTAGRLYPADQQASRDDVMQRVEEQLQTVLQSIGPDQPLWWTVQADRLAAARLSQNWNLVAAISGALPDQTPDLLSRDRIQAELILVRLAQKRLDDAAQIAGSNPTASGLPELDIARLRLFAALAARDPDAQSAWQPRALQLARQIESAHGDYWGRRASQIVVGTATESTSSGNLDLLVRMATEAQRKKQWNEALRALDAALEQAVAEDNSQLAYQLGFRAAVIEQEQQQFDLAAQRFARLAERLADHPEAHAAHLMACWNFSRTIQADQERFAQYEDMLATNVQTWPGSSSSDQTRIWLAAIRMHQQQYGEALTLFMNVNPASPLFAEALRQVRELLPAWVTDVSSTGTDKAAVLTTLARQLHTILESPNPGDVTGNAEQTRRQCILLLGQLRWLYGVAAAGDVSSELSRLLDEFADDPDHGQWIALQIVAMARENQPLDRALERFSQLPAESSALDNLRNGLTGAFRPDEPTAQCHEYLLEAVRRFPAAIRRLPDRQQYLWSLAQLEAVTATRSPAAMEIVTGIAEAYPRDATVQRRLGELLVSQAESNPAARDAALRQWRKIAAGARPHTGDWYLAKLQVTQLLVAAGREAEARKLLEFMRAVPPGWSQSPLADQFERLLREVGGR